MNWAPLALCSRSQGLVWLGGACHGHWTVQSGGSLSSKHGLLVCCMQVIQVGRPAEPHSQEMVVEVEGAWLEVISVTSARVLLLQV
jgi:hypothetical protein